MGLIVHIAPHCCVRVVKEVLALMKQGFEVRLLIQKLTHADLITLLPWIQFWGDKTELEIKLRGLSDVDVFHVHNEPDWPVATVREIFPDTPIVFDCHDLMSARVGILEQEEISAFESASAVVYPSIGYKRMAENKWHKDRPRPGIVIYSAVNEEMATFEAPIRTGGIVYEGGLGAGNGAWEYLDYRETARQITLHHPLTLYGAGPARPEDYLGTGAIMKSTLPYLEMLSALGQYDWGLVASPIKCNQWDNAMPNKLFEYVAAGIPVICFNACEAGEFVLDHGIGVVIDGPEQIPLIYAHHEKYRAVVMEKRKDLIMENQMDLLTGLYAQLTGGFYGRLDRAGYRPRYETGEDNRIIGNIGLDQPRSQCAA